MNKVCILSHARCRSSVLIANFSNAYNLENKMESYHDIKKPSMKEQIKISRATDKEIAKQDLYLYKLKNFTDELFKQNKWIIKVWPRYFNSSEFCFNITKYVPNLETYFRLNEYDHIVLSKRDPVDALCSLHLATKYGYNSVDIFQADYSTKLKYTKVKDHRIELNEWYKSFLLEICLIDNIREYLDRKNIRYTYTDFDEIPIYLQTLPKYDSIKYPIPIDTKIDYSNAVPNYDQISNAVHKYIETNKHLLNSITF